MVVKATVDGIATQVPQGVVHPAHIPFHGKAKAAKAGCASNAGPRGGLLGHGDDPGMQLVHRGVHLLQELDGLEVLAAPVDVRSPAALGP
ncbi:Uncharacterised protein [Mycobacteroides abscessus]|nr:Uncharacterised protein [Mycobacteroides abscessus]